MRSKASFFSPAIYRKNLTRFVPLWLAYLIFWIVAMPLMVLSYRDSSGYCTADLMEYALEMGTKAGALVCAAYAILVAMAFYGWYFQTKSVNALAALPIRREAWFCTNLLSALTVALVPHLIVALLTMAAAAVVGVAGAGAAMQWFAIVSLLFLFFYALAVLCAAVVGQMLALPVLFLLVNFTAIVLNYVTVAILSTFVYGMRETGYTVLSPLSPIFHLLAHSAVDIDYPDPESSFHVTRFIQWNYLAGLTAAAVVLLAVAFLLFRRRRMESAGDVIAVRPLRPVFKYCFATGCALVLGSLVAFLFFSRNNPTFPAMVLCLLLGGFIGYFVAEILLQKSFKVFGREWIGFGVFSLCLVGAMLLMELDVTGFERRVPELSSVNKLTVCANGRDLTIDDPALVQDFVEIHRAIVQDKRDQQAMYHVYENDYSTADYARLTLTYELKDGAILERQYDVTGTLDTWEDPGSVARRLDALLNEPELRMLAYTPDYPVTGPANFLDVNFYNSAADYLAEYSGIDIDKPLTSSAALTLTSEEAWTLYTQCILPDLQDGLVARDPLLYFNNGQTEDRYLCSLEYSLIDTRALQSDNRPHAIGTDYFQFTPVQGSRTAQYFLDRGQVLLFQSELDALAESEG